MQYPLIVKYISTECEVTMELQVNGLHLVSQIAGER